jgi:HAD superfamily hydrolase (TIGR01509 family)
MDGVIIDSNPFHKISLRQFCEKYGYQLSDQELINKIYGRTNKDWIANLFGTLSKEELSRYGEEKEALFREIYKNDIQALAGLPEFIKGLNERNIPIAIGTSAPRSNVDFVLAHTGLEKYFSIILDESNVEQGKPNPEIYLKVAAKLGYEPSRCIVFEDSLSGVESARRAGAKVVGVATTHSFEELSHTDLVIQDFTDLDPASLLSTLFKE